ncbi:MAG: hypothetical protein OCC49_13775 [Fibrobacterales bacterium]
MKNIQQLIISAVLLGSLFPGNSFAEKMWCNDVEIMNIYATGNRDDTYESHSQKLIVEPKVKCGINQYFFVEYNNPSYSSMLTLILNAKNTGGTISVLVDNVSNDENTLRSAEIQVIGYK